MSVEPTNDSSNSATHAAPIGIRSYLTATRVATKVLVTGATGLLGNNVCRLLLERGDQVRAIVRKTSGRPKPLADIRQVELVLSDLRYPDQLTKAVRGVDAVIHCAGLPYFGKTRQREVFEANLTSTRNLLRQVSQRDIPLVHVSSIDAIERHDDELSPYARSKRHTEAIIFEKYAGRPVSIARPGFMLGPNDWKPSSGRLIQEVIHGYGRFVPPGKNLFCDARDVAAACLIALDRGTQQVYQPGGHYLSYYDLFEQIAALTQYPRPIRQLRPSVVILGGKLGDLLSKFLPHETPLNSVSARGMVQGRSPEQITMIPPGLFTVRPLEETLHDTLAWFEQHGYLK